MIKRFIAGAVCPKCGGEDCIQAYTDEDKFKKMAEKKPILIELKNQFNLELDY